MYRMFHFQLKLQNFLHKMVRIIFFLLSVSVVWYNEYVTGTVICISFCRYWSFSKFC